MSADTQLNLQATVWGRADNRVAVLLMEFAYVPTAQARLAGDVVLGALLGMGLSVLTDLNRLTLPRPGGWRVLLEPDNGLTVRWPHPVPLVAAAPVRLPGVWRWAARRNRIVVLAAGCELGLSGQNGHPAENRQQALANIAERGALAAGAVEFVERSIA